MDSTDSRTLDLADISVRLAQPGEAQSLSDALSGQLRQTRTAQRSGERMFSAFSEWIEHDLCLVAETDAPTAAGRGHRVVGVLQLVNSGAVPTPSSDTPSSDEAQASRHGSDHGAGSQEDAGSGKTSQDGRHTTPDGAPERWDPERSDSGRWGDWPGSSHAGAEVRSVIVAPGNDHEPIALALLAGAEQLATDLGSAQLRVRGWASHPSTRSMMRAALSQHGYHADGPDLVCTLPVRVVVPTTEAMHTLGEVLASELTGGDVIVASGELGAGKTTFTQGIGQGLHVSEPVISPTFVLVRRHDGVGGHPGLIHVDAYRLGSLAELVDLDLDETMDSSVTVVEWGAGIAEELASSYLGVQIDRTANPEDDIRIVYLTPVGPRWQGVDLGFLSVLTPDDAADTSEDADMSKELQ